MSTFDSTPVPAAEPALDTLLQPLQAIGLSTRVMQHWPDLGPARAAGHVPMRVIEVHRDAVVLHDGAVAWRAGLRPPGDAALAVGDWVLARRSGDDRWQVQAPLPAMNRLSRRFAWSGERQVLVSNVDVALLVMGLDGDFNLRRLDRWLAMARAADMCPVVVLTKADLTSEPALRAAEVVPWLRLSDGEAVLVLDGRTDAARAALHSWLRPGLTLALLGASGAGKSTLANTLLGQSVQLTGPVRDGDNRGRHHTTARSLHVTPSGACLIDSPGLRALRLDVDEASLESAFDDIAALAHLCRFRDCRHEGEPGCAVAAHLSPQRLAAFVKLRRSVERDKAAGQRLTRLREAKGRRRSGEPGRAGRNH